MKKFLSSAFVAVLLIGLSACGDRRVDEDPQTVINKTWEKWTDESAGFQAGVISISGKTDLAFEKSKLHLEGSGEVQFDSKDSSNPQLAMKIDTKGNGSTEEQKASLDLKAELRLLGKSAYLFIDRANLDLGDPQTNVIANVLVNLYKSQWVQLPVGDSAVTEGINLFPNSAKSAEIAKIAKEHNFLEATKNLGNRTYEVTINPEKLNGYFTAVNAVMNAASSQDYEEIMKNFLKDSNLHMELTVSNDYNLEKLKVGLSAKDEKTQDQLSGNVNMSFEGKEKNSGSFSLKMTGSTPGEISASFTSTHQKKSVTIETPKDSKPFDMGALMGGFGGLQAPAAEEKTGK